MSNAVPWILQRSLIAATALLLAACTAAATPSPAPTTQPTGTTPPAAAPTAAPSPTVPAATLQIYAAASLKNAITKAKGTYEAANTGTTLTITLDSSAALETKIEQGAPADVFLSADMTNPQKLVTGGFASGTVVRFAGNVLTIVVPTANPAGIQSPVDLARAGVKIIACADSVPVQQYATQLAVNLAREAGFPADFAAAYARNIVSKEPNVAGLLAKVELGEGDAGIVYMTDAKASTKVTAIAVPASANVPATYGGVVVKASSNQAAAAAFLSWLASPAGQAVLATFGFQPAPA